MSAKTAIALASSLFSPAAFGYIGPGIGLGTLGVILGVVVSVLLALVAVVCYPIKRVFRKSPKRLVDSQPSEEDNKPIEEEPKKKDEGDD